MATSLTRRHLLAGAAGGWALAGATPVVPRPKNLVVIVAKGGWDTSYGIDPKPDAPLVEGPELDGPGEGVGTVQGLRFASNPARRPHAEAFFRDWGHQVTVVQGIWMGSIVHEGCLNRILTGTRAEDRPDVSVIHGQVHGGDRPLGNLDLSGISRPGPFGHIAGRVGFRHQLHMLLDHEVEYPGRAADYLRATVGDRGAVERYLGRRAEVFAQRRGQTASDQEAVQVFAESVYRAGRLRDEGQPIAQSLTLGTVPALSENITLTLSALSRGICRSVLYEDQQIGWDSHPSNTIQHGLWNNLFLRLSQLLEGLNRHQLLDDTLVVVTSEMTRTPRRNATGGKDHWPWTSAMVIGGGLQGGRELGATDDTGRGLPMNFETGEVDRSGALCRYDHFVAGVLEVLDIDPGEWLPGVEGLRALLA